MNQSNNEEKETLFHSFVKIIISQAGIAAIVIILAMFFVYLKADGEHIEKVEYARGMITLLFATGTIVIAILMTFCAIFSTDNIAKERFDRGKEILSLLIGIFGTILGFYFGSMTGNTPQTNNNGSQVINGQTPKKQTPPKEEQTLPNSNLPNTKFSDEKGQSTTPSADSTKNSPTNLEKPN